MMLQMSLRAALAHGDGVAVLEIVGIAVADGLALAATVLAVAVAIAMVLAALVLAGVMMVITTHASAIIVLAGVPVLLVLPFGLPAPAIPVVRALGSLAPGVASPALTLPFPILLRLGCCRGEAQRRHGGAKQLLHGAAAISPTGKSGHHGIEERRIHQHSLTDGRWHDVTRNSQQASSARGCAGSCEHVLASTRSLRIGYGRRIMGIRYFSGNRTR